MRGSTRRQWIRQDYVRAAYQWSAARRRIDPKFAALPLGPGYARRRILEQKWESYFRMRTSNYSCPRFLEADVAFGPLNLWHAARPEAVTPREERLRRKSV